MQTRKEKMFCFMSTMALMLVMILISNMLLFIHCERMYLVITSVCGVIFMIGYLRSPLKRDRLLIMSRIVFLISIVIGCTVGRFVTIHILLGILIGLPISDVLSFTKTKLGRKTSNAKIMSNIPLFSKLMIYVRDKNKKLIPLIGMGDIVFYSLLISAVYGLDQNIFIYDGLLLLGIVCNWILIAEKIYVCRTDLCYKRRKFCNNILNKKREEMIFSGYGRKNLSLL